jgi:Golgi phosphoprotein 3
MASAGGLSRRRAGAASSSYNDEDDTHRPSAAASRSNTPPATQHAGSAFEGGHKIAFDPRDLQLDASEEAKIGGKMPRLTIMEEVLLLGIKDKQVRHAFVHLHLFGAIENHTYSQLNWICLGIPIFLE